MRPVPKHSVPALLRLLVLFFSSIRIFCAAPPIEWAAFVSHPQTGIAEPELIAGANGSFYFGSNSDRPLIKFNSDRSIAWEWLRQPGTFDVIKVWKLALLSDGNLAVILETRGSPTRIFGQTFA